VPVAELPRSLLKNDFACPANARFHYNSSVDDKAKLFRLNASESLAYVKFRFLK